MVSEFGLFPHLEKRGVEGVVRCGIWPSFDRPICRPKATHIRLDQPQHSGCWTEFVVSRGHAEVSSNRTNDGHVQLLSRIQTETDMDKPLRGVRVCPKLEGHLYKDFTVIGQGFGAV